MNHGENSFCIFSVLYYSTFPALIILSQLFLFLVKDMAVTELPLAYHQQTHLSERYTFLACLKSVRFSLVILYESPIIDYNPMVDCCVMQN